jgi:hypothetical protein
MATISIFLLQIVSLKSQLAMEEDTRKNLDERLGAKVSHTLQTSVCHFHKLKAV